MNLRQLLFCNSRGLITGRAFLIPLLAVTSLLIAPLSSSADDEPKTEAAEAGDSEQVLKEGVQQHIARLRNEGQQLLKKYGAEHPQVQAKKQQLLEAQRLLEYIASEAAQKPATTVPATSTTPADDRGWLDFRLSEAAERDEAKIAELAARVAQYSALAEQRDKQLQVVSGQLKAMEADRDLEPIEGAETQIFRLAHMSADDASKKILSLFGARTLRVSTDDRSNAIVVFGRPDQMEQVRQLIQALDAPTEDYDVTVDPNAAGAKNGETRSVLLRVFWLADGLPEGEGQPPANYLPDAVLEAMHRLGLNGPQLVAQTVNSLASTTGSTTSFATHAPAILFKHPAQLSCSGEMDPVTGDRTRLQVQINITGHVGCDLSGSLVTPLGHYMVLGTANSIAGGQPMASMGMEGMPGAYGWYGGEFGGRGGNRGEGEAGGRGGEGGVGGRGGYGGEGGPGGEMGRGDMAMGEGAPAEASPADSEAPKYKTSRFAFVVQVIDGESYAPNAGASPRK